MFQLGHHLSLIVKFGVMLQLMWTSDAFSVDQDYSQFLSLRLVDVQTSSSPLSFLFLDKQTKVIVRGLSWTGNASTTSLNYTTFLNEEEVAHGSVTLSSDPLELPTTIYAGTIAVTDVGSTFLRVVLNDGSTEETNVELTVRACSQWYAIIPMIASFVPFLLFKLEIEVALFFAIFSGSWIIQGSLFKGCTAIFQTYLLEAVSERSHAAILLFIAGTFVLMKLVDKSGGTKEILHIMSPYTNQTRIAQLAIFGIGLVFYFDSYTSILVLGRVFVSILKGFPVSWEKIAFLVDSTALPLASIIPGSSWIVLAGNLLQKELDIVAELDDTIDTTGKSLIMSSIKYQFYPIMILVLILFLLPTNRDAGPLLGAENKERSNYAIVEKKMEALLSRGGVGNRVERSWNWWIPVATLTGLLWYTFVQMNGAAEDQDMNSISSSLMTCAAATVVIVQILFFIQTKKGGSLGCCGFRHSAVEESVPFLSDTFPSGSASKSDIEHRHEGMESQKETDTVKQFNSGERVEKSGGNDDSDLTSSRLRSLVSLQEGVECIFRGTSSCVPILVGLISAWAAGGMFTELGVGRIVVSWILDPSLSDEVLPIVAYFATLLLSLVLGSAWRTVSILIPALTVPLYQSFGSNPDTLVITLASVLSGAISGDHIGPFSETTILSGIISGGDPRRHFITQAPYALFVLMVSTGTGMIPMAFNLYPDFIGWIIGSLILAAFVVLVCRTVDKPPIVPGPAAEAITQTTHKTTEVDRRDAASVSISPTSQYHTLIMEEGYEDRSIKTEERAKQGFSSASVAVTERIDNTQTALTLKSFKSTLKEATESGRDPIQELVQIGILPRNIQSELRNPRRNIPRSGGGGRFRGSSHSEAGITQLATIENKKKFIEATIKKAEKDGNIFSDSLRMFLRTADKKLHSLMDEESLEIQASESAEVSLDDSLDNLMLNISSKDWRAAVNALQANNHNDADGSTGGDYTTDGASTGIESDDSASATSSTAYTGDGEGTSRSTSIGPSIATSIGPSINTAEMSQLKSPLEFGKSRKILSAWLDGELSVGSSCADERVSKASF